MLRNGRAFKSSEWRTSGAPIVRIQNLKSRDAPFNYFDGDLPDQFAARPGDLLFAWSGTPGTSFGAHVWNGPDGWVNQHIFRVDFPPELFDRDFLCFALNENVASYIDQAQGGVGLAHITKAKLNRSTLPAPPLAEQRQVAALLRDIDARHDSIADSLAAARAIVDRLRTAVLAAACSGRLTADWRDEHGHPISGPPDGPPTTWGPTRLGDIVRIATGATPLRKNAAYYQDGTVPWVTSGAVNAGIISEPTEMITPLALKETNVKLFPPGTLVIAMYGEGQTRGRVAELAIEAGTNQALAAILFDDTSAPFKPYLRLFFENGYQRMRASSLGGVQPNLSLGMFKETVLPLPPLDEQRVIVERAAAALATADRLRAAISSAEVSLSNASRAAVGRAFRGDLVPTEAEPIIGRDEPAYEDTNRSAVAPP